MGKRVSWFSAVRKALSHGQREKKEKRNRKSRKWFRRRRSLEVDSSKPESASAPTVPIPPPAEEVKPEEVEIEQNKNEQNKNEQNKNEQNKNDQNVHAYSIALASAAAAEAAAAAAQAAAEVVRLTAAAHYVGKSREELAAIKIQTAFRGYLARRASHALRGLIRLKSLTQGRSVQRQATTTLKCMQTMARVQGEIRARRLRMAQENQSLQKQLQQKHEQELQRARASVTSGDDWDLSAQSKEQVEAKRLSRKDAAMRREKALAYAYTHQTLRNVPQVADKNLMDPNNPHWGWSWLERWMAARPWENQAAMDKELDHVITSPKSEKAHIVSSSEFGISHSHREPNHDSKSSLSAHRQSRLSNRIASATPPPKAATSRFKPQSPRLSGHSIDDDTKSMRSVQSDRCRRHSVTGSSMRDDESLASSPAFPGYLATTESARAKARLPSPLGLERSATTDKGSGPTAKKRLSFSASPGSQRRHSTPANVKES